MQKLLGCHHNQSVLSNSLLLSTYNNFSPFNLMLWRLPELSFLSTTVYSTRLYLCKAVNQGQVHGHAGDEI